MGNRICGVGRRGVVEERLTRPQRLARQPSNVDYRKLRKLILSQKLAPCFDALEDAGGDLEECPICFFYYPSLNRSRCCAKGICTECFLQMKPENAARPAQCPFCKTSRYAVEYRGARTKEEKELELAEEQKVIEAKIRMRFEESQNVEAAVAVNRICSIPDAESPRLCLEEQSTGDLLVTRDLTEASMREDVGTDGSAAPNIYNPRFEEWDVDLEELMVMEAIWQSLQDSKVCETPEASGACSRILSGGDSEVNEGKPSPSLDQCEYGPSHDQCEASSSVACPLPRLVEDNGLQLEAAGTVGEIMQTDYTQYEGPTDESGGTRMGVMCLGSCSFTEHDPSWRSAQLVEGTHVSLGAAAFATEGFSSPAEAETRSCCLSYAHPVSPPPCDSPTFSNQGGGRGFPQLPGLIVERPMMIVMESNA